MYQILFLILFPILSLAQDCQEVNLITESNSPFNKIPVYDQDGAGICYAYAASQILDYYMIKNGESERKNHPIWLALTAANFDSFRFDNNLAGGSAARTMTLLKKNTTCDYETVVNALKKWTNIVNVPEVEILSFVELYYSKIQDQYINPPFEVLEKNIPEILDDVTDEQNRLSCNRDGDWEKLYTEFKALSKLTPKEIFNETLGKACAEAPQFNNKLPEVEDLKGKNDSYYSNMISSKLNEKKMPVSISYCANLWYSPWDNYDGINDNGFQERIFNVKPDCEKHESIVVGQKLVKGQCQYLIRNSWGGSWDRWNEGRKCVCRNKKTGELIDDCKQWGHSSRKFTVEACWISGEAVRKNTFGVTAVK